ncbi:MAG: tetratricopeptide repeat protein [Chlamydiota bacterium]|nr:tetratricopeptide repeat protein [Chlamydiota bacterium]
MKKILYCVVIIFIAFLFGCGKGDLDADYNAKIKRAKKSLEDDNNNPKTHHYLGSLYDKKGLSREAEQEYRAAISLDDKYIEAYVNLGNLYYRQKDYAQAVTSLEKALSIAPEDAKIYYLLASVYKEMKAFDKAIKNYSLALRFNPAHVLTYNYLGVTYYESKQFKDARESFLKAIELDPKFADAYGNLGILYHFNFHELDKAIIYYEKFLQLKNEGENVALIQELLENARKEHDETLRHTKQTKEPISNPPSKELLLEKVKESFERKDYKETREFLKQYISDYPDDLEARILQARVCEALNETDRALEIIEELKVRNKNNVEILYLQCGLYQKLNQNEKEKQMIEEFLRHVPSDDVRSKKLQARLKDLSETNQPVVKEEIKTKPVAIKEPPKAPEKPESVIKKQSSVEQSNGYFQHGVKLQQQNKNVEAIAAYRKAIQLNPENVKAHYNLGILYKWSGDFRSAIKEYNKTVELDPNHVQAHYNLGILYRETKLFPDAVSEFKKAIAINSRFPEAYLGLGLIYNEVYKDRGNAIYYFRKYIALVPNGNTASKIKNWLRSIGEAA